MQFRLALRATDGKHLVARPEHGVRADLLRRIITDEHEQGATLGQVDVRGAAPDGGRIVTDLGLDELQLAAPTEE